jgi:hypothetical protein
MLPYSFIFFKKISRVYLPPKTDFLTLSKSFKVE